jgi:hypothetical protein
MTLEEARQFIWMFHRNKATIEIAEVRQEGDETYAVDVVRVDGTEQTFSDAEATGLALAHLVRDEMEQGGLYATLNAEGAPVHCDFKTWLSWSLRDLDKRQTKIRCAPDVEATITFTLYRSIGT